MKSVKEQIAYLRGIVDSSGGTHSDEQMKLVFRNLIEILSTLAEDVEDLYFGQDEIEEYVEAIDADLADLEDSVCQCMGDDDLDDEYLDLDQGDMVEMECPNCQESIVFEEEFLYDDHVEVTCPECGETVFLSDGLDDDFNDDLADLDDKE